MATFEVNFYNEKNGNIVNNKKKLYNDISYVEVENIVKKLNDKAKNGFYKLDNISR